VDSRKSFWQQPPQNLLAKADTQQQTDTDDSVQEVEPPISFDELPIFSSAAQQGSNVGAIPINKRIYPLQWRTPTISRSLAGTGLDHFNSDDVTNHDNKLKDTFRPTTVDDNWGLHKNDAKEQQSGALGLFDPISFSQSTLPQFQCYVLFACASRPANPKCLASSNLQEEPERIPKQHKKRRSHLPRIHLFRSIHEVHRPETRRLATERYRLANERRTHRVQHEARPSKSEIRPKLPQCDWTNAPVQNELHISQSSCRPRALLVSHALDAKCSRSSERPAHPDGRIYIKTVRETIRNIWWFHHLLVLSSSDKSMSSFSQAGLLSDKLIRFSTWIEADSRADEAWSSLAQDNKEKISAQVITKLSDLFDIFIHWMHYHPKSGLTQCCFYQEATRRDFFVLRKDTVSHRNRQESISIDLMQWQDDFDKDFSEAQFQALAQEWPVGFPDELKPAQQKSFNSTGMQKPNIRFSADLHISKTPAGKQQNYPNNTEQPYKGSDQSHTKGSDQSYTKGSDQHSNPRKTNPATGECKIAEIPSLRLVKEPRMKEETGAFMNFGRLIQSARQTNPDFPAAPTIGRKQFCFRFMTARCGCIAGQNPRFARGAGCDKIHFDLRAGGDTEAVPNEKLQELIDFVRTAPIMESVEPTPELLARAKK
jgi:hypothetical protein